MLFIHFALFLHLAVLQNPGYLRLAVMYNQADIVEHALSLGLNAAEIDDFGVGKVSQASIRL